MRSSRGCIQYHHCVKRGRIRSYSGPHFPAFELNRNAGKLGQKNFEYGHFSRSDKVPESYFTEHLKGLRDSTELQSSQ